MSRTSRAHLGSFERKAPHSSGPVREAHADTQLRADEEKVGILNMRRLLASIQMELDDFAKLSVSVAGDSDEDLLTVSDAARRMGTHETRHLRDDGRECGSFGRGSKGRYLLIRDES